MKIKVMPRRRSNRVYYFDHKHGVLRERKHSGFKLASGIMVFVFAIGAGGLFGPQYVSQYVQSHKKTNVLQRQGEVAVGAETKTDNESDAKLKNASLKAREDEKLAKSIKSKLKNVPGGQKWSVYVRDLNSDRMASINADSTIDAAGLSNVFSIAPLEDKFNSSKWNYWAYNKMNVGDCVVSMISSNDANCAKSVARYTDMKNADTLNSSLGFKKTTLTDKKQQTTARETGDLLFRLQNGQLLSDKARRAVFDGLYGQKNKEGIPAGCDEKCLVAHAVGENGGIKHDAAIVTTGNSKYIVVIMTNNNASWSQIKDVATDIRQIFQP